VYKVRLVREFKVILEYRVFKVPPEYRVLPVRPVLVGFRGILVLVGLLDKPVLRVFKEIRVFKEYLVTQEYRVRLVLKV
jgi:hypothetical protein